jgi:hypothetical protein
MVTRTDILLVAQRPRVRKPIVRRPQRADQHPHGAQLGRFGCAATAELDRRAVPVLAAEARLDRAVVEHDLPAHRLARGSQFLEAVDLDDLGGHASIRGAHGAAEAEHGHLGPPRGHHVHALVTPDPVRHHDRLGPHVLEAVLTQALGGPGHGAFEPLRSAQTVTDAVAQVGQLLVRAALHQRGTDDACRRGVRRLRGAGRGGEHERGGQGDAVDCAHDRQLYPPRARRMSVV